MSEFSDHQTGYDVVEPETDISDFVQDSPEVPVETPSFSPTPEPVQGDVENVDEKTEETPVESSPESYNIDELYKLLQGWQESDQTFQTAVLDNQEYLKEQSKNLLSAAILLLFLVGVLTGVLFARVIWRKI